MVTMRQYTPEFRQSAVNLVLVEGLSARKAAENLGIPIHTIHSWVASARRVLAVSTSGYYRWKTDEGFLYLAGIDGCVESK